MTDRVDGLTPPPPDDSASHAVHPELDKRIVRGSAWVGLSYGGGQAIAIVTMLVLVRLLDPADFGIVALAAVLLGVLAYVQESGVGSALVHLRGETRQTAASALVFSVGAGLALGGLVVVAAPLYAYLVRTPELTPYVRALGLVLVLRGVMVVPTALLERDLDFKSRVKSDLGGSGAQAAVSIGCAVAGLGAWSLILGQIFGSLVQAVALWLLVPWRPRPREADLATLRGMLRYGRFVTGANLVNLLNTSIDNIVVGRILGTASLGIYALAWRLAELPSTIIGVVVGRVMFSVYSMLQGDLVATRAAYLQNLQRTMFLALPATVTLFVLADPIVPVLLGEQWIAAETPLRILALFGFVRLLTGPTGELFKGIGRPHLALASALVFFVCAASLLAILVRLYGVNGAASAMTIAIVIAGFGPMVLAMRAIDISLGRLLGSIWRPTLCSVPLAFTLVLLLPLNAVLPPAAALAVMAPIGAAVYVASALTLGRQIVDPIWIALRRSSA